MRTFGCGLLSARANAARMMCRDSVRAKIHATRARLATGGPVKTEDVLAELAKCAFVDLGDIYDFSGAGPPQLRPGRDIPPEARQAMLGIETTTVKVGKATRTKSKVVLAKVRALEILAKIRGLNTDPDLDALLGHLFASLPPEAAGQLRRLLAGKVRAGEVVGGDEPAGPRPGAPAQAAPLALADGGGGVPVGGVRPGPVAGGLPGGPPPPADGAGLPPGGQDGGRGGEDLGALFDD
jgi:hypothetical protein